MRIDLRGLVGVWEDGPVVFGKVGSHITYISELNSSRKTDYCFAYFENVFYTTGTPRDVFTSQTTSKNAGLILVYWRCLDCWRLVSEYPRTAKMQIAKKTTFVPKKPKLHHFYTYLVYIIWIIEVLRNSFLILTLFHVVRTRTWGSAKFPGIRPLASVNAHEADKPTLSDPNNQSNFVFNPESQSFSQFFWTEDSSYWKYW